MRLICPNCGAQYEVSEDAVPDGGRDVQCSNCGHTWFESRGHFLGQEDVDDKFDQAAPEPAAPDHADGYAGESDLRQSVSAKAATATAGLASAAAATAKGATETARSEIERDFSSQTETDERTSLGGRTTAVQDATETARSEIERGFSSQAETDERTSFGGRSTAAQEATETAQSEVERATTPQTEGDRASNFSARSVSEKTDRPDLSMPDPELTRTEVRTTAEQAVVPGRPTRPSIIRDQPAQDRVNLAATTADGVPISNEGYEDSGDLAGLTNKPQVDESLADLLREEAERERSVRRSETVLETQTDMPMDPPTDSMAAEAQNRMARLQGDPDAPSAIAAAAAAMPRKEALPNIDEINSTLRSSSERGERIAPSPQMVEETKKFGFRWGFWGILIFLLLALIVYLLAGRLIAMAPSLEGPVLAYVEFINSLRGSSTT